MYEKRRTIPMAVSYWRDKDVNIRKVTASSGLMPDTTRYCVFQSRKFYSDMLNLSFERHRHIARSDFDKKIFLKSQLRKAEKSMPGLFPYVIYIYSFILFKIYLFRYIGPHANQMELEFPSKLTSSTNDSFKFPSVQSSTERSIVNSESTFSQKKPKKFSNLPQISLERINRLAQPKGRRYKPMPKDHRYKPTPKDHRYESTPNDYIRPNIVETLTVQDIFHNIDDINNQKSNELNSSIDDKRFRQLIHLFSEVHERESSTIRSLKGIIQSNESLQYNSELWETKNTIEEEHDEDILNESSYSKTDTYLIDACA